jgi:hypothetical protein
MLDMLFLNYVRNDSYKVQYQALNELTELKGIVVIDPVNYLCSDVCMVMDDQSNYFYKDISHMRPWYAKKSLGYLNQILE